MTRRHYELVEQNPIGGTHELGILRDFRTALRYRPVRKSLADRPVATGCRSGDSHRWHDSGNCDNAGGIWSVRTGGARNLLFYGPILWIALATYIVFAISRFGHYGQYGLLFLAVLGLVALAYPSKMNAPWLEVASPARRSARSLVGRCQRQLAADVYLRRGRRCPGGLSRLPLRGPYAHAQSSTSGKSSTGVSGDEVGY